MNIIILNNNTLNNIIFKYKYNFFIKLYFNNYIKICKLIIYIIKYLYIYNIYMYKHTKNKSKVYFSNKKIRVQKGLGKARLKNFKSPVCKQGACNFGPFYKENKIISKINYRLIFIYLLINKRSNIIIIKLENIINLLNIFYKNKNYCIFKLLYLKGIINNKYILINLNNKLFNKNIFINIIMYNYLIFLI